MSKAACTVIFLLLLIPLASAQVLTSSFDSWIISESATCNCGISNGQIFIFNTGKSDTFQLSVQGDASSWISIAQSSIYVESGKTASVPFFVNTPCDAKETGVEFVITPLFGDEKAITHNFSPLTCQNVAIYTKQIANQINPCEVSKLNFTIENVGSWSETYDFSAPNTQFLPSAITLAPGAKTLISAQTTPACERYGSFVLPIKITPRENSIESTFFTRLDIIRNYTFEVTAGEFYVDSFTPQEVAYDACVNTNHRIPIEIVNEGSVNNIYDISLKGNAKLSEDEVLVPAGESKFFSIFYNPKSEKQEVLFLDVASRRGDFIKKIALPIESTICYDAQIIAPNSYTVQGPIVLGIENKGSRTLSANVFLEGSNLFSLDKTQISQNQSSLTLTPIAPAGYEGVEKPKIVLVFPDNSGETKVIEAVYGRPFFHVFGPYLLIGVVLLAILVLLFAKYKKNHVKKSKAVKKVKKVKKVADKEKKSRSFFPFTIILVVLLALLLLALIPINPLSKSISSQEIVFGADRTLRLDIASFIQGENITITSEFNILQIADAAYISSNTPMQSSITLSSQNNSITLPITTIPLESRGVDYYLARYPTLGYYALDYLKANWAISTVIIAILLVFVFFIFKLPKNEKTNQLSKLEH